MADVTIQDLPDKSAAFDLTTDFVEVEEDTSGTPKSVGVPFEDLPFLQRIITTQTQYALPKFNSASTNLIEDSNLTTSADGNDLAVPGATTLSGLLSLGAAQAIVTDASAPDTTAVNITDSITTIDSTLGTHTSGLANGAEGAN